MSWEFGFRGKVGTLEENEVVSAKLSGVSSCFLTELLS